MTGQAFGSEDAPQSAIAGLIEWAVRRGDLTAPESRERSRRRGEEEVFYSIYQAGVLLAGEDDDAAIATLLAAWQQRPQRAEPLYELVHLLRYRRLYKPAYVLARHGVQLDCPPDLLFVHRWIYEWGLSFELAIAAYWVGDIDLALEHNDALLAGQPLPPDIDAAVRENRHYCTTHPAHNTPRPSEKATERQR